MQPSEHSVSAVWGDALRQTARRDNQLRLVRSDGRLEIRLGAMCRDDAWAQSFGLVQDAVRAATGGELWLDLERCQWADPTPLLALALELELWRRRGHIVVLQLADPLVDTDGTSLGADFIHFLLQEGFLRTLVGSQGRASGANPIGNTRIRLGSEEVLTLDHVAERLAAHPAMFSIPVISALPARLIDLREVQEVPSIVEKLVSEARRQGLKKHIDQELYSDAGRQAAALSPEELSSSEFTEELRQILIELVENVRLHAYEELEIPGQANLVAVYARFRNGMNDARALHLRQALVRQKKDEDQYCPTLKNATEVVQLGFVEIFVCDVGIGLARHLEDSLTGDNKTASRGGARKHPLRIFFNRLASAQPFSRSGTQAERLSRQLPGMPGLKHLTRLLSRGHGFLRVLDRVEWAGASCPLIASGMASSGEKRETQFSFTTQSAVPVRGTFWLVRASTGEPMHLSEPWEVAVLRDKEPAVSRSTLAAWSDDTAELNAWRRVVFHVQDEDGPALTPRRLCYDLSVGGSGEPIRCVLWRPAREMRRNKIATLVEEIAASFSGAPILIVDQYVQAALTAEWTLREVRLRCPALPGVSLLSNHLAAVDLQPWQEDSDPEETIRLRPGHSRLLRADPRENLSLPHVLSALRQIDGDVFWEAVLRNDERQHLLLGGQIRWRTGAATPEDVMLKVYLDFPQAVRIRECRWASRRALGRFLAFCSPQDDPVPSDHLIEPLLSGLLYRNNAGRPGTIETARRNDLQLGSVVVSGGSLKRMRSQGVGRGRGATTIIAHFLRHPALAPTTEDGERILSLLPWSQDAKEAPGGAGEERLERVTDTAIVGPGGTRYWKAYRMDGDLSLYGIAPGHPQGESVAQAYAFWQRQGLLRLGHWHHGSHHDFVGVDLRSAWSLDLLGQHGSLGTFLDAHLRRLSDDFEEKDGFPRCHLLVCVASEITMRIADRATQEHPWLEDRIVFLPLVQRQRRAMRLRASPIPAERIRRRLQFLRQRYPLVRVLLLDTHLGSARTLLELKSLLEELGADEVHTLALLDRSRWPAEAYPFTKNWHRQHARMWRLDIDHLGPSQGPQASAGCLLCEATANVQSLLDDLPESMRTTRRRLRQWLDLGKIRTLGRTSVLIGLPPLFLPRPLPFSFGHDLSGKKELRIEIFEAGALATVALEAVTISGVHEQVGELLSWLEKQRDGASEEAQRALRDVKIYVLLGQALLMRHDVEFNRRLSIHRMLLETLLESQETSPATGFAALVLAGAETALSHGLSTFLNDDGRIRNGQLNIDCTLAVAEIAKKSRRLRENHSVRSLLGLVSAVEDYPPMILGDLFLLVGFREGAMHHTRLRKLLVTELTSSTWSNRESIQALVELVAVRLDHLSKAVDWLPEEIFEESRSSSANAATRRRPKDVLETWAKRLAQVKERLAVIGSRASLEYQAADRERRNLFELLYGKEIEQGPGFLAQDLRTVFALNIGQFGGFVENLLKQRYAPGKETGRSVFEQSGSKRFDPQDVRKVWAVRLHYFEQCIREHFDNAAKYNSSPYDSGESVRWNLQVTEKDSIQLEIRNRAERSRLAEEPHRSGSRELLERLGGEVTIDERSQRLRSGEFVVRIRMPTPQSLVSRDSSGSGR